MEKRRYQGLLQSIWRNGSHGKKFIRIIRSSWISKGQIKEWYWLNERWNFKLYVKWEIRWITKKAWVIRVN